MMRFISALKSYRRSLLSPFSCAHCPSGVTAQRERIKMGFEPSSLYLYDTLSVAMAAPAHPLPLFATPPSLFPPSYLLYYVPGYYTNVFLHLFLKSCPSASLSDLFSDQTLEEYQCHRKKIKDETDENLMKTFQGRS